jgi:hypothetical protein
MAALLGAPRSTIIKDWKTDSNRLTVGYLSKHRRGAWGKWRNRWCVLDHKTKELSWYTDEKAGGKALGSIVLTGVRSWPGYDNALEFRAAKAIYYAKCEVRTSVRARPVAPFSSDAIPRTRTHRPVGSSTPARSALPSLRPSSCRASGRWKWS